ncbi:hypothetical protein COCNU_scaffold005310G000010 [Cocos nucifera]|nr:hypothetical protein [Cocos nucifera]
MKIAVGAAKGLTYLHDVANPPVIYRDMKAANVLLDNDFNPKLSDFGLAKLGPVGDNTHVSTRVMGTYGYCDPDYAMSGKLTLKSDVYSFGMLLLELITGRKAFDSTKTGGDKNLMKWEQAHVRPIMHDVVIALNHIASQHYIPDHDAKIMSSPATPSSPSLQAADLSPGKQPLDWNTRIKIAVGAAKGLTYLHDVANPPVIYRDMKAANVLLDNDFNPKLSDFGLAKLGPVGDNTHVSTRVMGTYGYCDPDYAMSGKLTLKSDVYSFGMLLLELITGRKAFDSTKTGGDKNLMKWVCRCWTF